MDWLKEFKKHAMACGHPMHWMTPIGGEYMAKAKCRVCFFKIEAPIGEAHLLQKALAEQQCSGGGPDRGRIC